MRSYSDVSGEIIRWLTPFNPTCNPVDIGTKRFMASPSSGLVPYNWRKCGICGELPLYGNSTYARECSICGYLCFTCHETIHLRLSPEHTRYTPLASKCFHCKNNIKPYVFYSCRDKACGQSTPNVVMCLICASCEEKEVHTSSHILVKHRMHESRESACDDWAVRLLGDDFPFPDPVEDTIVTTKGTQ